MPAAAFEGMGAGPAVPASPVTAEGAPIGGRPCMYRSAAPCRCIGPACTGRAGIAGGSCPFPMAAPMPGCGGIARGGMPFRAGGIPLRPFPCILSFGPAPIPSYASAIMNFQSTSSPNVVLLGCRPFPCIRVHARLLFVFRIRVHARLRSLLAWDNIHAHQAHMPPCAFLCGHDGCIAVRVHIMRPVPLHPKAMRSIETLGTQPCQHRMHGTWAVCNAAMPETKRPWLAAVRSHPRPSFLPHVRPLTAGRATHAAAFRATGPCCPRVRRCALPSHGTRTVFIACIGLPSPQRRCTVSGASSRRCAGRSCRAMHAHGSMPRQTHAWRMAVVLQEPCRNPLRMTTAMRDLE